ncbi:hypothetical protein AXF42_Ash008784 [Apostasia shenzhenica]|uniref:VQ domain-containing protein n=1 Tax=Apostasia shenzhenica TaxID=1088818 RepID=A0A2I0ASJ0_9ASPA|nr:hypothetical protein AXF42_Ash008784 [Apostasia shenzhenica]
MAANWISEIFPGENEALKKALQISLSDDSSASETPSSSAFLRPPSAAAGEPEPSPAVDVGNLRRRTPISCPASGKIAKRRSRASKRLPTTYINADPANFRRMVQEVTGIRFGDTGLPVEPVFRPEPQLTGPGCVDFSAVLLDRACGSSGPGMDGSAFELEPFPNFPTLESWGTI